MTAAAAGNVEARDVEVTHPGGLWQLVADPPQQIHGPCSALSARVSIAVADAHVAAVAAREKQRLELPL